MGAISRIRNLVRGALTHWVGRRERNNPEAVYESAIEALLEQYRTLRQAAAGVIYMRGKLARELEATSGEIRRLHEQLEIALERDDDGAALTIIRRREALRPDVERLTGEVEGLTAEADTAKSNLVAFQSDIVRLREEKVRMLARLANARARVRLQQTLSGLSPDADLRALDAVREHINRLVAEVHVGSELGDSELEQRLGSIREEQAAAAARAELGELKRARRRSLVPMVLPRPSAAST